MRSWMTTFYVVFGGLWLSARATQINTAVAFIPSAVHLKVETWPCWLDIPDLEIPFNRSVYSAAATALGTDLYACVTTMHSDGGWSPIFESFCFIGGETRPWTSIPAIEMRNHFTMTAVGNSIVVAGGIEGRFPGGFVLSSVQVYQDGDWTRVTDLPSGRLWHCAVAISDHEVVFAGGAQGAYIMDSVELLDLKTGQWTSLPPMPTPRTNLGCTLWGGIYLLVAGGQENMNNGPLNIVQRLDLRQLDGWVEMPHTLLARYDHFLEIINGRPTVTSPLEVYENEGWELVAVDNFSGRPEAMAVLPCMNVI